MALNHSAPDVTPNIDNLMSQAVALAKVAASKNEVPIAAILVDAQGQSLAAAHNLVETAQSPLAHAEMLVLTEALKTRRYFEDCTLAVTLEPCAMCMAALCHARVGKIVFGAYDPKSGGTVNGARVPQHMHYKPKILGGIEENACRDLLQSFFQSLR